MFAERYLRYLRVSDGRRRLGDEVQSGYSVPVEAEQFDGFSGGGGIEAAGSIKAINLMLLQHEAGVIRVFSDWPQAMDTSIIRLRAKGAYFVLSAHQGGKITYVDVVSEKSGSITIQHYWRTSVVRVSGADSGPHARHVDAVGSAYASHAPRRPLSPLATVDDTRVGF